MQDIAHGKAIPLSQKDKFGLHKGIEFNERGSSGTSNPSSRASPYRAVGDHIQLISIKNDREKGRNGSQLSIIHNDSL